MHKSPEEDLSITPTDELFTYHIFGLPDDLDRWRKDVQSYSLNVAGMVDSPTVLGLHEIQQDFKPISADMVLQCMTNVHWGRVRFTGARLLDVLEHAGVSEEACKVALRGAEGFTTDFRMSEIQEQPDAFLLAYAMNDEPLTPEHGFPLRITADGKYGYKWCKWLTEIESVDYDFRGHYEGNRRWSDKATRGESVQ